MENVCLSGGAAGADLQFGMTAGMAGHAVIHWSFAGHKTEAPPEEVFILTSEQLEAADDACKEASKRVKRYFPPKSLYVRNLLRRNWYQVASAERVYAVATIDDDGSVSGGTAWAVAMFINRFGGAACECYVYDQIKENWFVWDGLTWAITASPKPPQGVWAGIGSRELKPAGKAAIRLLMGYSTPHEDTSVSS